MNETIKKKQARDKGKEEALAQSSQEKSCRFGYGNRTDCQIIPGDTPVKL